MSRIKRYISPLGGSYEVGPEGRAYVRDVRLQVMVSDDERSEISTAAREANTSVSSWLRHLAMEKVAQLIVARDTFIAKKAAVGIHNEHHAYEPPRRTLSNPSGAPLVHVPGKLARTPATALPAGNNDQVLDLDARPGDVAQGIFGVLADEMEALDMDEEEE